MRTENKKGNVKEVGWHGLKGVIKLKDTLLYRNDYIIIDVSVKTITHT